MQNDVITAHDLHFVYPSGEFRLQVAEFRVARGETVAVVGSSGTGKTTLLNLLTGILLPDSGTVTIAGLDLSTLGREDRQDLRILKLGLIFQEFALLEYLDVLDNVLLPYRISPVLRLTSDVRERGRSLLEEVGLADKMRRFPSHLSQGERQRVAVVRALVTEPAAVLGDEPTGNLDTRNRDAVIEILFRYSNETGAPLVVVTHDLELVTRFDRAVDVRTFI